MEKFIIIIDCANVGDRREIAKAVSNITEYSVNEIYDRIKDL